MSRVNIVRVILFVFLIRLALSLLPSFAVDMNAWLGWALRLDEIGMGRFYSDTVWTQYTPGYLYWLYIVGKIGWIDPLMIKIPVILADMTTAWLIWKILRKSGEKIAGIMSLSYVLNPVVIFDGSVWGQIDGVLTLLMLALTYYLVEKKNYLASYILGGAALLIKPQAVAIVPLLLFITWRRHGWRSVVKGCLVMFVTLLIGFWPFYPTNPIGGMLDLIQKMGQSYPFTSLFAFNLWSMIGMWQDDSRRWMGISYFQWGGGLVLAALLGICGKYYRQLKRKEIIYLMMALGCLIFFFFPTRVHERYLFPFFAFLTVYTGLVKKRYLYWVLGITSVLYLLNLYVPYSYYEGVGNALKNATIEQIILNLHKLIAVGYSVIGGVLLMGEKGLTLFPRRKE